MARDWVVRWPGTVRWGMARNRPGPPEWGGFGIGEDVKKISQDVKE